MQQSQQIPTGFQVVHANKLEDLRTIVVEIGRRFPLTPLENEIFLVHSNGIAQWLKLALARDEDDDALPGNGIAAAMSFSLPSRFLWEIYRTVLGEAYVARQSPFDKSQLVWRLMRLLPNFADDPVFEPLTRFLDGEQPARRRYQLAERIADLYDQYQVYRADWLERWALGDDVVLVRGQTERKLPPEQCWQPQLWRALLRDIGEATEAASRADVHNRFLQATETWPAGDRPSGLPRRIIVFGLSSLPQQTLDVLSRLGRCSQVLLCVHNPCQYFWADIVEDRELLRAENRRNARRPGMPAQLDDHNLHLHAQPLLAAWGKQGRDYIRLLDGYDSPDNYDHWLDQVDLFRDITGDHLLANLQNDILQLRPVAEAIRPQSTGFSGDSSVAFHQAHSPQREVEILHDQLLDAFSRDASLKPQDIIVMVPDIDAYSPHIDAVFGQLSRDDKRYVPYTISDQGSRHQSPILIALEKLLSLPESRIAVSDVMDLLDVPPLRRRFGLAESDLPLLGRWIEAANIRWGLHGSHRESLDLPAGMERNTWLFGLRRMLLGYAAGDDITWQGIEPLDEVGGLESRLAGQLDQLIVALEAYWQILSEDQTPLAWSQVLANLLHTFFAEPDDDETLLLNRLEDTVADWLQACESAELTETLPLTVVREAWLEPLDQGGLSQRFLAGKINFATLLPMRAIPFRHICLLGMNDGDYPRSQPPMDFDLMAQDYRPGDRSRREDDRYLFLEALLSARERLYISWVGRSINDNTARPPSVLVAQLQDHLNTLYPIAKASDGEKQARLSERLTVTHPLQPFSPDYFKTDEQSAALFTYAQEWRSVHQSGHAEVNVAEALPNLPSDFTDEPLTINGLAQVLRNPVEIFFQRRLGVFFDRETEADAINDEEPFVLDGLSRWQLTNEMIETVLRPLTPESDLSAALDHQSQRQAARGDLSLAPGLAILQRQQITRDLPELHERYKTLTDQYDDIMESRPLRLLHEVSDRELLLEGWVQDVRQSQSGERAMIVLSASHLVKKQKYRWQLLLRPWLSHLAANLAAGPVTTHILSPAGDVALEPVERSRAETLLQSLMADWLAAASAPIPAAPKAGFAWLAAQAGGKDSDKAAQGEYETQFKAPGEVDQNPYLQRVYPDFESLLATGQWSEWVERLYKPLWSHVKNEEPSA